MILSEMSGPLKIIAAHFLCNDIDCAECGGAQGGRLDPDPGQRLGSRRGPLGAPVPGKQGAGLAFGGESLGGTTERTQEG